ncbi:TIGR03619 family F420-dependent LLM class oxidoreductase [Cryptosporangium japonicum]|uniref:LLM class F420-dependent oxidoreductase n=1 Tax=Cryptosporangium japonicum TaxID=80872 RepID=A0ABN0TID2_9ACTN
MPLKLGVNLPQTTPYDLAKDVPDFAREAERIGYASLWVFERVITPTEQSGAHGLYGVPDLPWPDHYQRVTDPFIALAQAAAVTSRIALGTGVLVAPLHNPVQLAKTMASLDVASGGRLIAGLGSGWSIDEFDAVAPRPISERGAALDEFLDVAATIWAADPVSFEGSTFRLPPSYLNPKPSGEMPIFLGGLSAPALRRIAERRLGWLPTGLSPAQTTEALSQLRDSAGAELPCITQVGYLSLAEVPSAGRAPYTGSPAQLMEDLAELAAGGVEHVYLTLPYGFGNLKELIDAAEQVYAAAQESGLLAD